MIIEKIEPQGFCFGVINALDILNEALEKYDKVYVLGNIIHNKTVNEKLKEKGVIIIDKNFIPDDGVVVLTAHGTSPELKDKLPSCIDATCPFIKKIHEIALNHKDDIIYVGKDNHPETISFLDYPNIKLITSFNDLDNLGDLRNPILINQTTLSTLFLEKISKEIKKMYPNIIIYDKICNATKKRQNAVLKADFDLCFVVGDKSSSNANELANLRKNCVLIESYKDIDLFMLKGINKVCVTSASSTPDYLVDEVIVFLNSNAK